MAIEEMELLDMTFDKKYLKEVLCQLKETKYFYPQPATKIVNNVKDVFTMTPDEDYKNMLDELKELAEHVGSAGVGRDGQKPVKKLLRLILDAEENLFISQKKIIVRHSMM